MYCGRFCHSFHIQDGGRGYIRMLVDTDGILWSVLMRCILVNNSFFFVVSTNVKNIIYLSSTFCLAGIVISLNFVVSVLHVNSAYIMVIIIVPLTIIVARWTVVILP